MDSCFSKELDNLLASPSEISAYLSDFAHPVIKQLRHWAATTQALMDTHRQLIGAMKISLLDLNNHKALTIDKLNAHN